MDKLFESRYSLNVARLSVGRHTDQFEIDDDFFAHFDKVLIEGGKVTASLAIDKFATHMVVDMKFAGEITLLCDRCLEPYSQPLATQHRVVYSFDRDKQFGDNDEVIVCSKDEPRLSLVQEFYDFMALEVPYRSIPPREVHLCAPDVLQMLNLDANGHPLKNLPAPDANDDDDTDDIDPRWAALKNLK